jgi:hypothetical protein
VTVGDDGEVRKTSSRDQRKPEARRGTMAEPSSVLEQKDHGDPQSSDNSAQAPGEALAKFDFAHTNLGTQGPDYSDAHAVLASMSSDDALDYAISQMGPADHLDVEHFDTPADTSHDT